jgi:hypothetical protein
VIGRLAKPINEILATAFFLEIKPF